MPYDSEIYSIDNFHLINNIDKLKNKENDDYKKEENNNHEDNDNDFDIFDEEKEKLFYTNQKNFFKARKDIIEEPEYLEDDNENNDKNEKAK